MPKPEAGRPAAEQPAPKKRHGCLLTIGIAVLAVLLIVGLVVGIGVWRYRRLRDDFTDTALEAVPIEHPDRGQERRLARTFEELQRAAQQGRRGTFTFTGTQLNQLVASVPAAQQARGRAHFTIVDDKLKVKAGLPLDHVPGFQGRFLNGEFTVDLSLQNDQLDIRVLEATVHGRPLPAPIMNQLRSRNLADHAMRNEEFRRHLEGIEAIHIENNRLTIQTGTQ